MGQTANTWWPDDEGSEILECANHNVEVLNMPTMDCSQDNPCSQISCDICWGHDEDQMDIPTINFGKSKMPKHPASDDADTYMSKLPTW